MKYKKITLVLSLLITCFVSGTSQVVQFTDVEPLPEARSALTSANDGENIYVVNGFGRNILYTTEVFQYNTTQDSWSILTNATIPKRYASAEIVGDHLYVLNGEIANGMLNNQVEKINLENGEIEYLANHPQPSRAAGVATWDNKIYTFGGTIGQNRYSDKLFEFDPEKNVWRELATLPFAGETKGEIVDGKLYVIGGYNGRVSNQIDVYNIANNEWESSFDMLNGISAHATTVIGRKIYIVGDFSILNSLVYFNTFDNTFQYVSSNLNRRRHCAAEGVGNSLYALGGNTTSSIGSAISDVQKADFVTSINEVSNIQPIEVFPNPTNNLLNISEELEELVIFNIQGQEISRFKNTKRIELGELKNGFYILRGYEQHNIFQTRFLKL